MSDQGAFKPPYSPPGLTGKRARRRRLSVGGGPGAWRWGICLTYRRWLNLQMHKAGLSAGDPYVFIDGAGKQWAMTAETIVSVLIDAGEHNDRIAVAVHQGIIDRVRKGEPMKRILEQFGAWLIEQGYFIKDGQTYLRRMKFKEGGN